jgi:hypothetical protein
MTRLFVRFASLILLASLLLSCTAPIATATATPQHFAPFILVTQDPNASATPTPFQPSGLAETPLPTFTASPPPTATFTSTPPVTATFPPLPSPTTGSGSPAFPTSSRTNYILYSTLDFQNKSITTDQTIRYYNNTGTTLSDIVLSVQPNIHTNAFVLNSIAQDGTSITSYTFSGQRLTVNLPQPLGAGSATTLTLNFKLNIPQKSSSDVFGYDFNQINLVDWYPFIVPHRGGWILHDPSPWGEHLVYDSSDIELNIKTGSDIILAIGASPEQNGEWTRYRMYGARTLAISASDEFIVSETTSGSIAIRSYYFSGFQTGGADMLTYASQAINTFSRQVRAIPAPDPRHRPNRHE